MLQQIIAEVLILWCNIINERIESKWSNLSGIQGEAHTHQPEINLAILNTVIATLEFSGGKAWIAEFGSGSLMDSNNPYLQEYLSGSQVNQWRFHSSRMPIMGRSAGEYTDLDGKTHVSSGKMAGLDLERDGKPEYQPHVPLHIIKHEVEAAYPEIVAALKTATAEYIMSQLSVNLKIYV